MSGAGTFPSAPVEIGANRHVHILLDRKTLTTAYPQLTVSGGEGANIRLTYAEALYDEKHHKGDRDEVGNGRRRAFMTRFCPTANRIARLSRFGGGPGAI